MRKIRKFWQTTTPTDAPDILTSKIGVPETVYLVASGPNGCAHYWQIPTDAYVIAVNQAVLIPDIQPSMWVLNSVNKEVKRWIRTADIRFDGIRVFKQKHVHKLPRSLLNKPFYRYDAKGDLRSGKYQNKPGTLYAGGTVSGFAIQIAANLGAKTILLCGVDMSGEGYWDGTLREHPKHGETWNNADSLNLLIKYLSQERGLTIKSLSPTKLDVPVEPPDFKHKL